MKTILTLLFTYLGANALYHLYMITSRAAELLQGVTQ